MNYLDLKDILYASNEAAEIPLGLEESIPFRCVIDGEKTHSFLYWKHDEDDIGVRYLLAVNEDDGHVIMMESAQLKRQFELESLEFNAPKIESMDEYCSDIDKYNENYEKMCEDPSLVKDLGRKEYALMKKIVGTDVFEKLFEIIADEFIQALLNCEDNKEDSEELYEENKGDNDCEDEEVIENKAT